MKVEFVEAAELEIRRVTDYYDEQRPGLGTEFFDSVEDMLERVRATPEAFPRVSPHTRRCVIRRFPYALFYHIMESTIVVDFNCPTHRDPISWQSYTP